MEIALSTLSLYAAKASPDLWRHVARRADQLGFESMWIGHHMVFPLEISKDYPYSLDGSSPLTPEMQRLDPFTILTHLSAVTDRLRFGTGVYILPLINPFVTARAAATAEFLAPGRFELGIGVGWNRQEYDILGEEFTNRGARADEIIDILRLLWTEETVEYHGTYYDFEPVKFEPKPRPGCLPIIYGGLSEAALARCARVDGCFLPTNELDHLTEAIGTIRRHREAAGTADEPYRITTAAPFPLNRETLRPFEDLGVIRVSFDIGRSPLTEANLPVEVSANALSDSMEQIAEVVIGEDA